MPVARDGSRLNWNKALATPAHPDELCNALQNAEVLGDGLPRQFGALCELGDRIGLSLAETGYQG